MKDTTKKPDTLEKAEAAQGKDPSKVVDLYQASKHHKKANGRVYALKDCYTTPQVGLKLFGSTAPRHIQPLYRSHWKN